MLSTLHMYVRTRMCAHMTIIKLKASNQDYVIKDHPSIYPCEENTLNLLKGFYCVGNQFTYPKHPCYVSASLENYRMASTKHIVS